MDEYIVNFSIKVDDKATAEELQNLVKQFISEKAQFELGLELDDYMTTSIVRE
jgi:hypothetical protein